LAEHAQGNGPLSAAVADVALGVALALGEGGSYALSGVLAGDDAVALAAIRVLGADVLAPYALDGRAADGGEDEPVIRRALAAYPPGADASDVSVWSYHGLVEASRAYLPGASWPARPPAGDGWARTDPWPQLTHRAAQLAALSLPGLAPALAGALATRTVDLSRGFVRAVRRRDWLQAAGVGRWLARMPGTPDSLGLDSGLAFVRRMSGGDPRVALHLAAARRFHGRGW
jgi:hypothetical protein